MGALELKPTAHVVDVLGNVIGRDQPILRMEKALEMVAFLGEEVFADENVVFFDPFCKAGELLLDCAFLSCKAKSKKAVLDLDFITKEIYESNRYFGMAPDERHHRLSLRTFLGNEVSHNEKYNHIIRDGHYVSEEDGRLDIDKFEKEFKSMIDYIKSKAGSKKIVAVGNPPYQEDYSQEGNNNRGANLIYNYFLEQMIKSEAIDEFMVVIPSRWFAGGRGKTFKKFFLDLRKSKKIKQIYDFQNAKNVFPTVDIKGGVCFLHWDKFHDGDTRFYNHEENTEELVDLSKGKLVVREKEAKSIISKVQKFEKHISDIVWSWNPFNLPSNYFKKNEEDKKGDLLECYTVRSQIKKISRNKITKNIDAIDLYKVAHPKAIADGGIPHRADQILILSPGQICTETYIVVNAFKTKKEAELLANYLRTDFVRFLVSIKKITHDMTKDTWCLVPLVDPKKIKTAQDLYEMFELNQSEIKYIKQKTLEW